MPLGVHGLKPFSPTSSLPAVTTCSPSTSLSGSTSRNTASESRWPGSGSCTSIPCSRSVVVEFVHERDELLLRRIRRKPDAQWRNMPSSWHAFSLLLTYVAEAGSSPHEHHRQARASRPSRRVLHTRVLSVFPYLRRYGFAVYQYHALCPLSYNLCAASANRARVVTTVLLLREYGLSACIPSHAR